MILSGHKRAKCTFPVKNKKETSVMEKSGFFNSSGGDRVYDATDFTRYFGSLATNGVFWASASNLKVSPGAGVNIAFACSIHCLLLLDAFIIAYVGIPAVSAGIPIVQETLNYCNNV